MATQNWMVRCGVGVVGVLACGMLAACSGTPARNAGSPPRVPGVLPDGAIQLPNQWTLRPAGEQVVVNEGAVNSVRHPTGAYLVVLHAGQGTHGLTVLNTESRKVVSSVELAQCFYGVAFSADGSTVYASGGEHEVIHAFDFADGYLSNHREIRVVPTERTFVVGGLAPSPDGKTIYACGVWGHEVAAVGLDDDTVLLAKQPDGSFPYTAVLSPDGSMLYVSLWGGSGVAVLNAKTLETVETWATPSHPTEMALTPDGGTLYVACSNANRVAAIDTANGRTREVIDTALYPGAPNGSTPASLDLSEDGSVLAVANADNNNVAVFDVGVPGHAKSLGFVPVGWYASSVRFGNDGGLLVCNAKGIVPKSNRHGPNPEGGLPGNLREYIASIFDGVVSFIDPPTPGDMARYTKDALACSPLRRDFAARGATRPDDSPIPAEVGGASPITHCVYIIKENRTYDQVFGDMPEGNGDPSLCLFPERVTPNHHALAREFVLLDNFYVESEVSADGHEWTMGAYATDFVERTWPLTYRGNRPATRKLTYPSEGAYDIAVPTGGYLWDRAREAGISYRSYGEWVTNGENPGDPGTANAEALEGHIDPYFHGWDLDYLDVDRAARFIEELHRFEREGEMPRLQIMRLPNDHTAGTRVGAPTPRAMVADNDLALGRVIEALSRSKFWESTAVFVIQDDAQNGPDHVDAHRTVALVVSPYTRRGVVDSTLYSTASMLRTMGLILGTRPMSQFDAAAIPMYASFAARPDMTPYKARPNNIPLDEMNTRLSWGADVSESLDFDEEDAADDLVLNEIVWRSVRGADSAMPPPVRAAFVWQRGEADEDEED